jgi:hypothetical protein
LLFLIADFQNDTYYLKIGDAAWFLNTQLLELLMIQLT